MIFFTLLASVIMPLSANAEVMNCSFLIYNMYPFMDVQAEVVDGALGAEASVTSQGQTNVYPILAESVGSLEKFKFTILDGTSAGQVYVTVFNELSGGDNIFKSMVSNPEITIPSMKDVLGTCTIY